MGDLIVGCIGDMNVERVGVELKVVNRGIASGVCGILGFWNSGILWIL